MSTKTEKGLRENVDLGDDIKLAYQNPEVFYKYHAVYYGHKFSDYYLRNSQEELIEKSKMIDAGYFIIKGDKVIGGVFLKPNFMTDLFIVPPFNDYEYIADKVLNYLKEISKPNENIIINEVVEEYVPFYKNRGCTVNEENFWMVRPTEEMEAIVPEGYEVRPLVEGVEDEVADVIMSAYEKNPCYESIDSKERYVAHVEYFIKNQKKNEVMDKSSRIVIHKDTNEIVGTCLHMEFEGVPLIMSYVVRPDHQGKGVGSYLLKNSINSSSERYPITRLSVLNNNPAIKVYEHLGFIKNRVLTDLHLLNK